MVEKRSSPRLEHEGEARFELESASFDAQIANISEGGALLVVEEDEVGSELVQDAPAHLYFCLPNDPDEEYQVSVRVSHFHKPDDDGYRVGLQFTDESQPGVLAVREFIDMFSAFL